jgi:hypothetical protein
MFVKNHKIKLEKPRLWVEWICFTIALKCQAKAKSSGSSPNITHIIFLYWSWQFRMWWLRESMKWQKQITWQVYITYIEDSLHDLAHFLYSNAIKRFCFFSKNIFYVLLLLQGINISIFLREWSAGRHKILSSCKKRKRATNDRYRALLLFI